MNETAVDEALKAGTGDLAPTLGIDEPSATRMIRYVIDVFCKERQRQKAEDTLRKLWRAVEQSADLVMITDRGGAIEYVNPAFEALTGYSTGELMGKTPRILKFWPADSRALQRAVGNRSRGQRLSLYYV